VPLSLTFPTRAPQLQEAPQQLTMSFIAQFKQYLDFEIGKIDATPPL